MRRDAAISKHKENWGFLDCMDRVRCADLDGGLWVATLGPRGTSSEIAASHVLALFDEEFGADGEVVLYPSFEEAGEAVLRGRATAVVVANAYSEVNALYMNPAFFLAGAFILPTPDYGVVAPPDVPVPLKVSIATHPAPAALVKELVPPSFVVGETLPAPSTSEAARMVAQGEVDLALTNETSAREHRLRFVSRTRPIRMLWSVFVSAERLGRRVP
jgi:ABC-type amino acid transport substrate-binding protein